jgi:pimeloyl-ACP methyl ester carboxylesterase
MVRDVIGVIDHLRLGRVHLVGYSQGAVIAAYFAAYYPDQVASATLIAGPFFPDSAAYAEFNDPIAKDLEQGRGMVSFFRARGLSDSAAAAANADFMSHNDAASLAAMTRMLGQLMLPERMLRQGRVPSLVIVGTRDPLAPDNRRFSDIWPGARFTEVDGANHISIRDHRLAIRAIRDHVRSHFR